MPGTEEFQYRDRFPWVFCVGFALIYTPIISYVNAKLEGMVGQHVSIPMLQTSVFILSGYKGATIWFAPIPLNDYSWAVQGFRVMELTGTRLSVRWVVLCDEHAALIQLETKAHAMATKPDDFCDECRELLEKR